MASSYRGYLYERWRWANKGVGGTASWASLGSGALVAVLLWKFPNWTREHVSEKMSVFLTGLVPLAAGASVFIVRWFISPFPVYKKLRQKLDIYRNSARVRGRLGSYLLMLEERQQELRKIEPPYNLLMSESEVKADEDLIDEIMNFVMRNIDPGSGAIFLSDTGLTQVKGDNFFDRHLIKLSNRATRLAQIINEYKLVKPP